MKSRFNINVEIARHLCMAQEYSELAKQYIPYCLREVRDYYYNEKRVHVNKALELINKNTNPKECRFTYYIDECIMEWDRTDQIGQITYFTYRDGVRLQISFHVPPPEVTRCDSYKGLSTKWDHKSSHQACEILKDIFNLKYKITQYY